MATHADDMLSHISEVAKNYGESEAANARYDAEISASIKDVSDNLKKMTESQRGKYLESIQGTPYRLMFDDAGEVATKQVSGYNADAMSVSLKQVSGNLKHAPTQAEISESAMKVKDTLEDIIGDRAHVVISDSMKTSDDGTKGTRAFLDPETGVFYVNNKFKFDERFTELATAIHELYHAAEGTKQSAELHRALGEFVQAFPEVSDQLTGGVGETITNDIIEYFNPKLNAMQQGYVNATEIDADILGKLLGSEEYVAKLAVRNENLVKKLYTYLKAAGKSTQSKQVRRALDKLTRKFGNALDHAKGGVLVSQIGDEEEKESTATSINEENMQVTVNDRASLSKTKIENLKNEIVKLGQLGIKLNANGKVIKILTDKFTEDKNIFSKKGRTLREVNARIKAIPYFNKILKESKYSGTDTNIRGLDSEAKKGVVAMHSFKGNYGDFEIEALIRDKGAKQFLYEIKFIENEKSSQQSMTDKSASPAPKGDVENNAIISQADGKSNTFEKNSSKKSSSGINDRRSYAGVRADTADHSLLSKAQEMLDEGYDGETVRKETGWFKGYDGKWRFEIDDSSMEFSRFGFNPDYLKYKELELKFIEGNITDQELKELQSIPEDIKSIKLYRLDQFIKHDELFAAYPELRRMRVTFEHIDSYGAFYPNTFSIKIDPQAPDISSTLIHEIQHAIQHTEGLTSGTEIKPVSSEVKNRLYILKEEQKKVSKELDEIYSEIGFHEYSDSLWEKAWNMEIDPDSVERLESEFLAEKSRKGYLLYGYQKQLFEMMKDTMQEESAPREEYMKTAGEIEARDVQKRLHLDETQRKNTRPDIDQEDVVLAEGSVSYFAAEDSSAESDSIKEQLKKHSKELDTMDAVEDVKYAVSNRGKARSDADEIFKRAGYRVDRQDFGIIEIGKKQLAESSNYLNTPAEFAAWMTIPKVLKRGIIISGHNNHKQRGFSSVTIAAPVTINGKRGNVAVVVQQKGKNKYHVHRILMPDGSNFVYENIQQNAEPTGDSIVKENSHKGLSISSASNNSIPQNSDLSTKKSNINDRFSKTGKDTVEMSRGEIEKLRANYMSEKVFDKKGVSDALNGIPMFKKLPSDVRSKLIEGIWTGFNEHRAYDRYIEVMTEKIYATIMQETDFELYELDVKESKDAEKRR